jgi:hypothetical protein
MWGTWIEEFKIHGDKVGDYKSGHFRLKGQNDTKTLERLRCSFRSGVGEHPQIVMRTYL